MTKPTSSLARRAGQTALSAAATIGFFAAVLTAACAAVLAVGIAASPLLAPQVPALTQPMAVEDITSPWAEEHEGHDHGLMAHSIRLGSQKLGS